MVNALKFKCSRYRAGFNFIVKNRSQIYFTDILRLMPWRLYRTLYDRILGCPVHLFILATVRSYAHYSVMICMLHRRHGHVISWTRDITKVTCFPGNYWPSFQPVSMATTDLLFHLIQVHPGSLVSGELALLWGFVARSNRARVSAPSYRAVRKVIVVYLEIYRFLVRHIAHRICDNMVFEFSLRYSLASCHKLPIGGNPFLFENS